MKIINGVASEYDMSKVTPIESERQPFFRKHYDKNFSCPCGKKLERKWLFCPYCGREIDWSKYL